MVCAVLYISPMTYSSGPDQRLSRRFLARRRRRRPVEAFTLVETGMATMMVATVVGALFLSNGRVLQMLRFQKETIAATHCFQERMEKIRGTPFTEITDSNYLRNTLLATDPPSKSLLANSRETVTVSAYPPDAMVLSTAEVTRANGSATVNSSNPDLVNGWLVRIDLELTWTSIDGRSRLRRTSTVIGKGHISQ
jgi:hypothetical protein